jgi:F420-dependent oxidoreductase-like protein
MTAPVFPGVAFGVHTGLQETSVAELTGLWRRIEELGFDWISVWDHLYAATLDGRVDCLEGLTMHAALACRTQRVRCGALVYAAGYRNPGVLAKAITVIDHLSGGRAEVGIGAGWHEPEATAFGIPFPPVGRRMELLEEAAEALRRLLHEGRCSLEGRHVVLRDARNEPRPVQARVPVWVGGGGERRTLRVAARWADGWNVPFVDVATFAHKSSVLDRHCEQAGRDPAAIRRAVNLALAWTDESLARQFGNLASAVRPAVLAGSEQEVVDRIGAYVAAGADQVNIAVRAPYDGTADDLARLAAAVGIA